MNFVRLRKSDVNAYKVQTRNIETCEIFETWIEKITKNFSATINLKLLPNNKQNTLDESNQLKTTAGKKQSAAVAAIAVKIMILPTGWRRSEDPYTMQGCGAILAAVQSQLDTQKVEDLSHRSVFATATT